MNFVPGLFHHLRRGLFRPWLVVLIVEWDRHRAQDVHQGAAGVVGGLRGNKWKKCLTGEARLK